MSKTNHGGSSGSSTASQNGRDKWSSPLGSQLKGGLTWGDVDPEDLVACVAAVTEDGAALLLAKTSDGGALLVQVLGENSKPKWYPASMAALTELLEEITSRATAI